MEAIEGFVNKYGCVRFESIKENALTHQYNDLLRQCNTHNDAIKHKKSSKKGKKQRLANAVCMLLKMKEIAEQKELEWYKDRTELIAKIEEVSKGVSEVAANTDSNVCECDELRDEIEQLVIENESPNQSSSLFTPGTERTGQGLGIIRREGNTQSTTLSIQDRTNLCQILGKFDTSASPISLSNRLEAVVAQYILNNRDACALLRAWLPLQLCEKLQPPVGSHRGLTPELNSNWGNSADRMREMQRIMGGRDTRGSDALENTKFRRGMDPILFCSEYLSIYKLTYNCPDMSPDDGSFLCSMANKCTCIDYHTRIALRNATSYQTFLNTLRDWVRETEQDNRPHKRISEIAKSEGRVRFTGKCYRCGNTGHLIKDCKLPRRSTGEKKPWHKKEQKKPGPDKGAKEPSEAPDATVYGPLLKELQRVGKGVKESQEEYRNPPSTNPYFKQ
ncbi:hypothetical protein AB205_0158940 [Aquarana catesbeiana]|uniref:CCHC-type domain-containing protein n=1 Tax=Aquarana catesbeiana TaxID=8400 RepID=A0A2G9QCF5_AQUCT|nr:hypothetical protein AB205_0158940 [Aquarana catesbeiana]